MGAAYLLEGLQQQLVLHGQISELLLHHLQMSAAFLSHTDTPQQLLNKTMINRDNKSQRGMLLMWDCSVKDDTQTQLWIELIWYQLE